MKFKNNPNKCHTIIENGIERQIFESRSVAVNCVVVVIYHTQIYILASLRGKNVSDFPNKVNLISGYLDWNETATDAVFREVWEETGLNIPDFIKKSIVIKNDLNTPWNVKTEPDENRQNISLRYGIVLSSNELPKLTTNYNEFEGEVESNWWMKVNEIDDYEWAFNHNNIIKNYINFVFKK